MVSVFQRLPGGKCSNCSGVYIFLLADVGLILFYLLVLVMIYGKQDFLNNDLLNRLLVKDFAMIENLGGWSLSHFIVFFFVGILFPDCGLLALSLGIVWEIIEEIFGRLKGHSFVVDPTKVQYKKWAKWSLLDIVFNFIGFFAGKYTVENILKDKPVIPYINDDDTEEDEV